MAKIDNAIIPEVQKIGVYAIHNKKNGKYYIGSSVNVFKRMKQQKRAIKSYGLNDKILSDMFTKKFDLEFIVLETFEDNTITDKQLRQAEYKYIQKYDSIQNGYNTNIPFPTGKFRGLLKCNVEQKRATAKFEKERYDKILLRLPKGTKERIQEYSDSVNGYIATLIEKDLKRKDRQKEKAQQKEQQQ